MILATFLVRYGYFVSLKMLARYSEPVDNTVESYDSSHLDVMFVVSSATTQEITKRREVKGKKKKMSLQM